MYRRFRKAAVIILASSVLMHGSVPVTAEETLPSVQTEAELRTYSEAQTQAPTEAQTQAATEAQTQAPTEAQTQSPTEAQTQAPTEAQTQAATEAQAQTSTEAQTQAPTEAQAQTSTEAQTQAPTEAQTQAAAGTQAQTSTGAQTQTTTEAQAQTSAGAENGTEKQSETERSERINDGEKMSSSDLTDSLESVLPYLFAAETVEGSEDILADQEFVEGNDGSVLVSHLADFSKKLANAVSSSDVEVVNLYADEKGRLDTAQLDELCKDQVIDVTKKYYVVNVIADSADQTLDFSGYDMTLSGKKVAYSEDSQPGDILYNFVALDGDDYSDYKGTVTLSNGAGLQGTFLAPSAEVKIKSDLAGAVYAKRVIVEDSVEELLRIVFVEGCKPESGTGTGTAADASEPGAAAVSEIEKETEEIAGAAASGETKEAAAAAVGEIEKETEEIAGAAATYGNKEVTEEIAGAAAGSETEAVTEETADETIDEAAGETGTFKMTPEEETLDIAGYLASVDYILYSNDNVVLNVQLTDSVGSAITSVTVTVRAAVAVVNSDGSVKYHIGDTVSAAQTSSSGSVSVGGNLTKGGKYYLELSNLPTDCYGIQRLYFSVNDSGVLEFDSGMTVQNGTLTIKLYKSEDASSAQGTALLTVMKAAASGGGVSDSAVSDAVFVLKDSEKKIIKDSSGNPSYYIHYQGTPVLLTGLDAGTYYISQISTDDGYQIAEDTKFTINESAATNPVGVNIKNYAASGLNALDVTARAYGNGQLLTAEEGMKTKYYAALFRDQEAASRVSAVQVFTFAANTQSSNTIAFSGLESGTYYLVPTNELGEPLTDVSWQITDTTAAEAEITGGVSFDSATGSGVTKNALLKYKFVVDDTADTYPDGDFSYTATIELTNKLLNYDGTAMAGQSGDVFSVELYEDAEHTKKITSIPIKFDMEGKESASQTYTLKMTSGKADYYLAEAQTGQTLYTVSFSPNSDGKISVTCGSNLVAKAEIQNRLNDTTVHFRLLDSSSGEYISGVTMVVKDGNGKIVYNNGKALVFKSKSKDYVVTNVLTAGQTYYLSQVSAPSGYAPSADISFEVQRGLLTEVSMYADSAVSTNYTVTVTKQVYSGEHQVYAQDNTSGTYAAKGKYTFYAALFADAARIQKVSDVQKITVKGLGGSVEFKNLAGGTKYYVAETDQYGEPLESTGTRVIKYADSGVVTTSSSKRSTVIQNVYSGLPAGYRYTARLTLTKKVVNASGEASGVTETFYAGIFRKADYSDTPTIIKLDLQNASSTYASRRILLPNSGETTYYIAEVDADGSRVDEDTFGYTVNISAPTLKITAGDDASVTITNKAKSSKVTLYLTKKVYEGVTQKAVSETFYAGLFKDKNFTQLYTKPIPLQLNGKSELTLKLSLNLGSASKANIYIAEVDQNGNVIKNEEAFGYEIKIVNSTAAFTQEKREIQTILLNSVYGSVTDADWQQILGSDGNDIGDIGGVSGNGEVGEAAQTGDDTPIALYVALMAAAAALIAAVLLLKKKRR